MKMEKTTSKRFLAYLIILAVLSLIVNGYPIFAGKTADIIPLSDFLLIVFGVAGLLIAYVRAKSQ